MDQLIKMLLFNQKFTTGYFWFWFNLQYSKVVAN